MDKRKKFYDTLAAEISIDGIKEVKRDHEFDDEVYYRSGGIRLIYESQMKQIEGIKEGILLEAGFDRVTPDLKIDISSWTSERIKNIPEIQVIDNIAYGISCYHPGYTFVEKLQTIATKFRKEQETGIPNPNFMRQYYDVAQLLNNKIVQAFIGTDEYHTHKKNRFPQKDYQIPIAENEAFALRSQETRKEFETRYKKTAGLYYDDQPPFDELLETIAGFIGKL